MSSVATSDVNLDAVFAELGQFGRHQQRKYYCILVVIIFNAIYNTQYIFTAGPTRYRCQVPQCEASPPRYQTDGWGRWALPSGGQCSRMVATGSECGPTSFSPTHSEPCSSWVYENHNTIVSEFGLACQEWRRTLVGTVRSAGVFTTLPITALVSDVFGRRIALIVTAVAPAAVGLLRAGCTSYVWYLLIEFGDATLGAGSYSVGYVLALEMVGIDKRVIGGNIMSMTFAVGQMLAGLIAWGLPYWRTYTLVIYTPSILFIFYYCLLEESVRWLLSKGRKTQAVRIILKIAATNGKQLTPETVRMLTEDSGQRQSSHQTSEPTSPHAESQRHKGSVFKQVVRSRTIMIRLCVCSFWWISVTFIYYGLSINSVMLPGSKHVNYILMALIEIPGCLLSMVTLNRFGRKSSIIPCFFVCGFSLFALPFVSNAPSMTALNMVGKLCISMIFCSIYIYTLELFPTSARQSLMNACSMLGRIGSMSAPQTPLLMAYMQSLPYLIFGSMAVGSGLLMLLMPETLRASLPDTVRQAEDIDRSPREGNRT